MLTNTITILVTTYLVATLYTIVMAKSTTLLIIYSELSGFISVPLLVSTALLTQSDWLSLVALVLFLFTATELIVPAIILKSIYK